MTLVAWRWEGIGGALLVLVGIAVLVAYPLLGRRMPPATILSVLATLALPPLVAGILLLTRGTVKCASHTPTGARRTRSEGRRQALDARTTAERSKRSNR
jgi:hypothetical protein